MKTVKRFALVIAIIMLAAMLASCAEKPDVPIRSNVPRDTLIVAYAAEMNGDFIYGFGNNAYDLSIKTLLHGYCDTYTVTPAGEYVLNKTIVKEQKIETDDAGNKTYTFTLHNDLKWSNGEKMTASDYVAQFLWYASPQWREAGATSSVGEGLIGYKAYYDGDSDYFAGIKVINDTTFSMTIDAEELPYFFEVVYVAAGPLSLATYSPGNSVVSDDNGVKFANDILADAQRIAETAGGERFEPTVVCGPYTFVSFSNQICTLKRNPNFKGDANGKKPKIENIIQQAVPDETEVDILLAGDIDLLPSAIEGEKIERAKADEYTSVSSYLRNGYGVMHIICDWSPTKDPNVRWAIACLVDRTQLLDQVLGGYGGLVDSEMGVAQWMYQAKEKELKEALIPIDLSIDKANDFLDLTEWKYEADGSTPFDRNKANESGNYMRHNSSGEMLVINHAAASPNVGEVLEIEFQKNTPLAGIKYNFDAPDFNLILDEYYDGHEWDPSERTFSTYSMGTGFTAAFDPYYSWHSDWLGTWYNSQGVNDPELDALMVEMRSKDPADKDGYLEAWFKYQVRWNQLLPSIPLYANEYFDLFNSSVKEIPTTPFRDWYEVICDIEKWPAE